MSIYGPNQVEELIIGNTNGVHATAIDFINSAADKEIQILTANGVFPSELGEDFKVFQKTAGNAAKGLNYEFSDVIKASKVENVILKAYVADVLKQITVTGFVGNVVANTTYAVEIRLEDNLSPENFTQITGYYTTRASVANETAATIRDGVLASLNTNLTRRGGGEFLVTASGADITVTEINQEVVVGKITGRKLEFIVTGKQFDNTSVLHENLELITATETVASVVGNGTGKYAVNLEWFTKGYKYESYRQTGFPADFTERTPVYASINGVYNVIHIKYKSSRISPSVEEQPKVLTILIDKVTDIPSNNTQTNTFLNELRTVLGIDNVPVDLPTV